MFDNPVFTLIGLIFSTALVLFLAWFLIRLMNRKMPGAGGTARHIKVLDKVQLTKGGGVFLLKVNGKIFLVAMTEHGAEKIAEFEDDGEFDLKEAEKQPGFAQAMMNAMKSYAPKNKKNKESGAERDEDI